MLIEFTIENFRSIREQQTLSLVAKKNKEDKINHLISSPALRRHQLVPAATIYGANAAGKTNIIRAAATMQQLIMLSAEQQNIGEFWQPYLFSSSTRNAPTRFEVIFIHQGMRYQYGFSLDAQHVHEEYLYAYPRGNRHVWFEREWNPALGGGSDAYDWYFGPSLRGEKKRLAKLTRPNALFLSVAALFNHKQLSVPFDWFASRLRIALPPGLSGRGTPFLHITAELMEKDPRMRQRILSLMQDADFGIVDITVEEEVIGKVIDKETLPSDMPDIVKRALLDLTFKNITLSHEGDEGEDVPLNFGQESAGTQRLFALAGPMLDVMREGRVLFIDELESSLHPLLAARIVRMFHNPRENTKGAQLIFNTHNTYLLGRKHLRRDEIWFVEKGGQDAATRLVPFLDYHPRKHENRELAYLQGRYGAVPILGEAW